MNVEVIRRLIDGRRGKDYVENVQRIAGALADISGYYFNCQIPQCDEQAELIGMHGCGHPGPMVCKRHWREQREWIAFAEGRGPCYCRHCDKNVEPEHITAVPLIRKNQR